MLYKVGFLRLIQCLSLANCFVREEMQWLFDKQVHKLLLLIDKQLQGMQHKMPSEQIVCICPKSALYTANRGSRLIWYENRLSRMPLLMLQP